MPFRTSLSFGRWIEDYAATPLVAALLRSSLHPLLSRWLLLLSYEGHRSGRRYTTPVLYWTDSTSENSTVLFVPTLPEQTNWWRNFRGGHPLTVRLRGTWRDGRGEVLTDDESVFAHLRRVAAPSRRASRVLLTRSLVSDERLERITAAVVLVRVTLSEDGCSSGRPR